MLDVGCGAGDCALFLASKGKAKWVAGVDLLRDMIRVAEKKAADRNLTHKVCFLVCDGRQLPFKSSFFDGIVSRGDAFCFLVPLKAAIEGFRRVIKSGGVVAVEMDNRVDWKPGSTISAGFVKTNEGHIAYVIVTFTRKRKYKSVSHILDPNSKAVKNIACDAEFQKKGFKPSKRSLTNIKKETLETRRSAPTQWPTRKGLTRLFTSGGFTGVHVIGNGLLMDLLGHADPAIVKAMKRDTQLFFRVEKSLVCYVNPETAPTIVLRANAP